MALVTVEIPDPLVSLLERVAADTSSRLDEVVVAMLEDVLICDAATESADAEPGGWCVTPASGVRAN